MLKKIYHWVLALLGIGAGVVVCRSLTGRLADARKQLKDLRAELKSAGEQLASIEKEQRIADWLCNDIKGVIAYEGRIYNKLEAELREDDEILRNAEAELAESRKVLDHTREIIARYTIGADNK